MDSSMPDRASEDARKFIAEAEEGTEDTKFDYTLGFLLPAPPRIQRNIPMYARIPDLCRKHHITACQEFMEQLERRLFRDGIPPLFPADVIVHEKKAGALQTYYNLQDSWGCHLPFFIQISGEEITNSLFFIFRSYRDGIHRILLIFELKTYVHHNGRNVISVRIRRVTEHVVPGMPSYCLFDWDAYRRHFAPAGGHDDTDSELQSLMACFPGVIQEMMIAAGVLYEETEVKVIEKRKHRDIRTKDGKPDKKFSAHFLLHIFDFHKDPLELALGPVIPWLDAVKGSLKKTDSFGDTLDPKHGMSKYHPLIGMDRSALPGGANGFNTSFSVKTTGDPYPELLPHFTTICLGLPVRPGSQHGNLPFPAGPQDPYSLSMSNKEKRTILYYGCYTFPRKHTAFYTPPQVSPIPIYSV